MCCKKYRHPPRENSPRANGVGGTHGLDSLTENNNRDVSYSGEGGAPGIDRAYGSQWQCAKAYGLKDAR